MVWRNARDFLVVEYYWADWKEEELFDEMNEEEETH
jgi:hypothetical protein